MSTVIATPMRGQPPFLGGIPTIELEDGRVLDPNDGQPEAIATGCGLADELSTALAEPRYQQDADAFEADDPTEEELCELYAATVQREEDPAAEAQRIGAMIAGAIPNSLTTITRMNHLTIDANGGAVRNTEMWAVLVTAGGGGWYAYEMGASIRLAAARVMERYATR